MLFNSGLLYVYTFDIHHYLERECAIERPTRPIDGLGSPHKVQRNRKVNAFPAR